MNGRNIASMLVLLILTAGLALTGCSSPSVYQLEAGDRSASTEGEMIVSFDDNDNRFIEMNIAHLPPPSRLDEQMSTFVVWLQPKDSTVSYNMGQLQFEDDRTGKVKFTTPFDSFEVRVTAEAQPNVLAPSDHEVLYRGIGME